MRLSACRSGGTSNSSCSAELLRRPLTHKPQDSRSGSLRVKYTGGQVSAYLRSPFPAHSFSLPKGWLEYSCGHAPNGMCPPVCLSSKPLFYSVFAFSVGPRKSFQALDFSGGPGEDLAKMRSVRHTAGDNFWLGRCMESCMGVAARESRGVPRWGSRASSASDQS